MLTCRRRQGINLAEIDLVIRWRETCDACTLWQQCGRGARDFLRTAIAISWWSQVCLTGRSRREQTELTS
ncbi:hypothetical protein BDV98DRAFT_516715 [Pterulicium gracile]|uniref:Helicase C-terminal domain-containing protein n=1 Tax=Pterulicium gracile TaxID=1884261 RepID=A0A5C3Q1K1_9AGAR|nr:hypothetical protein BDV98DRAFT_516715 [Pterula gracilis]